MQIVKAKKTARMTAVFFSISIIFYSLLSAQTLTTLDQEISRVVHKVSRGVVTIEARPPESRAPIFPGQELNQNNTVNAVIGSGLLVDSLGHILTILSLVDGFDDFRVVINGISKSAKLGIFLLGRDFSKRTINSLLLHAPISPSNFT